MIISCVAMYIAYLSYSKTNAKHKVEIVTATITENGETKNGIVISVKNSSPTTTMHLTSLAILHRYKERTPIGKIKYVLKYYRQYYSYGFATSSYCHKKSKDLQKPLESYKSHELFISNDELEEIMKHCHSKDKQIRASVQDQLWRNSYSNIFDCKEIL